MRRIEDLLAQVRENPRDVRFVDLVKVCAFHFGEPRQHGTAHVVFRMPWEGDPRVNIQNARGSAKPYQVKQVLAAIDRLKGEST